MERYQFVIWVLLALSSSAMPAIGDEVRELAAGPGECHEEGKDQLCGHAAATLSRLLAEDRSTLADTPRSDIDVIHCFLDIELNFSSRTLSGSNTLTLESRTTGLAQIVLDLRDNMVVESVSTGSRPLAR